MTPPATVHVVFPPIRAMQVAHGVKGGSRRGPKGGARIDGPTRLFCIRPAMEAVVDEQPSLVLLVPSGGGR
jgi:hypothetical protein